MKSWSRAIASSLLITLSCALSGLAQELKFPHAADLDKVGKRDLAKGVNFYSLDKETTLGKQLAQEIERASRVVNDPDAIAYVNALAQKLAKNSDARMPITVGILESKTADVTTLPGGYLYVNSALILDANNEAELAGVIAHGIALTAMRSGTAEATKGDILQLASIPSMTFIPYSWAGWGVYQGQNLAIPLMAMKVHGQYVLAADYFAAQYVYVSGYDPGNFVELLERIGHKYSATKNMYVDKGWYPSWSQRTARLRKEIADILPSREGAIQSTSDFEKIKEKIRLLKPNGTESRPVLRKKVSEDLGGSTKN